MIRPGLERIKLLLQGVSLPWRAIHVAGTNGKGSVCAYVSAMLHRANIRTGRFTSPHLIDVWDCIRIDEKPIQESIFRQAESRVKMRNEECSIGATPFELLTATAFEIFQQESVQVGVVECGMGGRLDSTNVLEHPLVTVITSIGLDHEAFLGNTLAKIANEKAGIIKAGSPCVAEALNDSSVVETLRQVAESMGVELHLTLPPEWFSDMVAAEQSRDNAGHYPPKSENDTDPFVSIQLRNKWLAYQAIALVIPKLGLCTEDAQLLMPAMADLEFPGRFQNISLMPLTGRKAFALLDGAHNDLAMKGIRQYRSRTAAQGLNSSTDTATQPWTWVIACSSTKGDIFEIPEQDNVVITEFGAVDGMPWVKAKAVDDLLPRRHEGNKGFTARKPDVLQALELAAEVSREGPMVITGSLYLVSDVLRLLRDAKTCQT